MVWHLVRKVAEHVSIDHQKMEESLPAANDQAMPGVPVGARTDLDLKLPGIFLWNIDIVGLVFRNSL